MCLDVLRAIAREGDEARAVIAAFVEECSELPGISQAAEEIETELKSTQVEAQARRLVERLALLAAAAALAASAPTPVAQAFARARVLESQGRMFGSAQLSPHETGMLLARSMEA